MAGFAGGKRIAVRVDDAHVLIRDRFAHRAYAPVVFVGAGDPAGLGRAEALRHGYVVHRLEFLPIANQKRRRGRGDKT